MSLFKLEQILRPGPAARQNPILENLETIFSLIKPIRKTIPLHVIIMINPLPPVMMSSCLKLKQTWLRLVCSGYNRISIIYKMSPSDIKIPCCRALLADCRLAVV